jgi:CDP-glucose 4,6-dehydratase
VLEPLSGYLALGAAAAQNAVLNGEAFNFGPRAEQNHAVVELLHDLAEHWGFKDLNEAYKIIDNIPFHEAGLLKLNCDKALFHLKWESNLFYPETTKMVTDWFTSFYLKKSNIYDFTLKQIEEYESLGKDRKRVWSV